MPARLEQSAGVIAFHIPPEGGERRFLLLDYGRHWDYPKGHLEEDENEIAAAIRELREETGIEDIALIDGFQYEITYSFRDRRKGGQIQKTVTMFLGETKTAEITLSHEHVGSAFLPYEKALARLTYPNAREILVAAQAFLDARPPVE